MGYFDGGRRSVPRQPDALVRPEASDFLALFAGEQRAAGGAAWCDHASQKLPDELPLKVGGLCGSL